MSTSITRRAFTTLLITATVASCAEGKLARTISFELRRSGWSPLERAILAFALQQRFKTDAVVAHLEPSSPYWPNWLLTSEDIDVTIGPAPDPEADGPPDPSVQSIAYLASFYDHGVALGSNRMAEVVSALTTSLGSVEGVTKLGDEQAQ